MLFKVYKKKIVLICFILCFYLITFLKEVDSSVNEMYLYYGYHFIDRLFFLI